ncbi:hypothetical protein ACFL0O_00340 [Thermodesulfobacteriota bacterium]
MKGLKMGGNSAPDKILNTIRHYKTYFVLDGKPVNDYKTPAEIRARWRSLLAKGYFDLDSTICEFCGKPVVHDVIRTLKKKVEIWLRYGLCFVCYKKVRRVRTRENYFKETGIRR